MDFDDFVKLSTVGGDEHARQAWEAAVSQIKAALPDQHAKIDAALAPEPEMVEKVLAERAAERVKNEAEAAATLVKINAMDSGATAEGQA